MMIVAWRRKLKKSRQEKMKQIKLIQMSMLHPGDVIEQDYDADLFSASKNEHLIKAGIIQTDVDVSTLDRLLMSADAQRKMAKNVVRPTKEVFGKTSDKYYDKGDNLVTFEDSDVDSDDGNMEDEEEDVVSIGDDDEEVEGEEDEEEDCSDDDCEGCEDEECEGCDDEECEGCDDDDCEGCDLDASEGDEEMMEVDEDSGSEIYEDEEQEAGSSDSDDEPSAKRSKTSQITDLNFDPSAPNARAKELKKTNSWFNSSEFSVRLSFLFITIT